MKIKIASRKYFLGIFFCLLVLLFPLVTHALTPQEVLNPQQAYGGWVTDMAGVLSENSKQKLNQQIGELEATNGTEIAVVTVPTTQPSPTPKDFTTELFNYWGIGKQGVDNGILFLVSIGDRRVEIETGYGIEGILPDARVGNIIDNQIIPNFREGNFEQGILDGTSALINAINLSTEFESLDTDSNLYSVGYSLPFFATIFAAGSGIFLKKEVKKATKPVYINSGVTVRLPSHKKYPPLGFFNFLNFLLMSGLSLLVNFLFINWLFQSSIHIDLYNSLQLYEGFNTPQSRLAFSFQILVTLWNVIFVIFLGHFSTLLKDKGQNITIVNLVICVVLIPVFLLVNMIMYSIFSNSNYLSSGSIALMVNFWIFLSTMVVIIPALILARVIMLNSGYWKKSILILTAFIISLIVNGLLLSFTINNFSSHFLLLFFGLCLIYFVVGEFYFLTQEERNTKLKSLRKLVFSVLLFSVTVMVIFSLLFIILFALISDEVTIASMIPRVLSGIISALSYGAWLLFNNGALANIISQGNSYDFMITFLTVAIAIFSMNIPFNFLKKRFYNAEAQKPRFYDEKSKEPMKSVSSDIVNTLLKEPELVAQKIGSVEFEGWIPSTDNKKHYQRQDLHIRAYTSNNSKFEFCPHCQELTMIKTSKTTVRATTSRTGIELITSRCQCCDHIEETEKIIPMVVVSSSSSYGGGGGSSGGGGSFGGGSSGGGGAGGSW